MQVQCDDVTYFVTAQALGVTNQVVCYSRSLDGLVGAFAQGPDIRVDLNKVHQMLGLAWRGAPPEVQRACALDVNMADRVVVLWLAPLCECASHEVTHYTAPPYRFRLSVATNPTKEAPCYMKVWAK